MTDMITTQAELRRQFWRDNPHLSKAKIEDFHGDGFTYTADTRHTMKHMNRDHIKATERQISPGRWWEGPNQEVVRVVSHKPPHVRYAQHSYDGAVCRATSAQFLRHYKPIDEDRATQLLQHPARTTPKVIELA